MKNFLPALIALLLASLACTQSMNPATPGPEPTGNAPQVSAQTEAGEREPVPTPVASAQVTASKLNIRKDATYHSDATGDYLQQGQAIVILECSDGWAKIGEGRWVRAFYLNRGCR